MTDAGGASAARGNGVGGLRGDRAAVDEALDGIRASLAVDGYQLEVDRAEAERLSVRVIAVDGACEECLAPAEVLKMIISGGLDGAYRVDQIELALPPAAAH